MATAKLIAGLVVTTAVLACDTPPPSNPIYLNGRAVHPVDDTLLAFTQEGLPGILLLNTRSHQTDTVGTTVLHSPVHVQEAAGRWYVSDTQDGRPFIAVLSADGQLADRIDLTDITPTAHQFAVLPNGDIVVPGRDEQLVLIAGDSVSRFALTEVGTQASLLVAASGGVLHAAPNNSITLYNAFGHIRWRVEWPWRETVFISDLAVDARGRIHMIAGITSATTGTFLVYSLVPETGEVIRWSPQGPFATFAVDRWGEVTPDSAGKWIPSGGS